MKPSTIITGVKFLAIALILTMGVATIASAANLINGDFETCDETGWTHWRAPWGSGEVWNVVPVGGWDGCFGELQSTVIGDFGWFQRVPVTQAGTYAIDGEWAGDIGDTGWAEILYFPANSGDSDASIITRIDTANAADIAYKKDSWGMNPPTVWGAEPMSFSPFPGSNGGTIDVTTEDQVVIAITHGSTSAGSYLHVDNLQPGDPNAVILTGFKSSNSPSPSALVVPVVGLAAGAGILVLACWQGRRRRGDV
jgi:hypothetical protein